MVKTASLKVKKTHEKLIFNGENTIFKGEKEHEKLIFNGENPIFKGEKNMKTHL